MTVPFLIARKPESPRLATSSRPVLESKERIQAVLLPARKEVSEHIDHGNAIDMHSSKE